MVENTNGPAFRWNPEDYRNSSPAQKMWAEELVRKLALTGNERVLDIGCGDGSVTAGIARKLPWGKAVGIDSSSDMIGFACKHFSTTQYPNLSFRRIPAESLDYREEFDIVFSNAALHWIPDHLPILTGIGRALVPGGRMLIQMGGKGNAAGVFKAIDALIIENESWGRYFSGFSFRYGFFGVGEYRTMITAAGMIPVRVDLIQKDMTYQSREGFAGWIRTTWLPWICRIPAHEQLAFINALVDKFCAMFPQDAAGTIHVGMVRLEVEAIKD
ncbi:class I SAM-dependent methyltransferase [Methanoregula sp.]|uniref:class I SAM-dependent methyltransferase n=1 Tax=Methanoregula sp. TaxID=2052170 RepID=UPI003C713DA0